MLQAAGMTSAILNPLHEGLVPAVKAADVLMGNDPNCTNWIAKYRAPPADGEAGGGRGGRRRGGRRRG